MSEELMGRLMKERYHNRRLRHVLMGAVTYGALATIVALLGWLR